MKYFTIQELCASSTARAKGIKNDPTQSVQANLERLVNTTLDPVRELWGKPITVNSGYRCPALNTAVGGAKSSQHLTGEAADITTGSKERNKRLFDMIKASNIPYDQLIDESGYSWLHISCKASGNRKQVLHL